MPRDSGNRDAANRQNSSVHGGFSKATATRSDLTVATRYLRNRNVCKWQRLAGSGIMGPRRRNRYAGSKPPASRRQLLSFVVGVLTALLIVAGAFILLVSQR
jgi:hypothetical protein